MFFQVRGNEAGPSAQMVRHPKAMGSKKLAELYARILRLEEQASGMEEAISCAFRDLHHDLERLESNGETQKKFVAQELAQIEEQTQEAEQRAQSQIDSLCQQTSDLHSSLTSIHRHSAMLRDSLKTMMEKFKELQFDLPNAFDSWLRVRENRESGTMTGAELQRQSLPQTGLSPLSLPFPPPAAPPPPTPAPSNPFAPDTHTRGATHSDFSLRLSGSTANSPSDAFQGFMYLDEPSDALRTLTFNMDEVEEDMEVDEEDREGESTPGASGTVTPQDSRVGTEEEEQEEQQEGEEEEQKQQEKENEQELGDRMDDAAPHQAQGDDMAQPAM